MRRTFVLALVLILAPSAGATEFPPPDNYLMGEAEELRLAATAGPTAVTEGASYYVLRGDGYHRTREGGNGFHCFVDRSWSTPTDDHKIVFDPRVKAPHCINHAGAESTMQEIFLVARLIMEGATADGVRAAVDAAYAAGELLPPSELSLTYMMSKHQWLGPGIGAWKPHLMIWVPYLEAGTTGSHPPGSGHPVVAGDPGSRKSVLIVPLAEWVE